MEKAHLPHQPVLYHESLKYLQPKLGGKYVDGTLGAGGHAEGILTISSPNGILLGLDVDNQALIIAKKKLSTFGNRCIVRQASYEEIIDQIKSLEWDCVDGVLLDLGLSSMQLNTAERGFSFLKKAPLDLRFNPNEGMSAAELINTLPEKEIASIIWNYSEESHSREIARLIIENRPISTTTQLASLIIKAYHGKRGKTHPATRTFQALRIAVNRELEVLEKGLENSLKAVCTGGRIVVITFHSLEDRIVKQFFKRESIDCICPPEQPFCTCDHQATLKVITKKTIKPSQEEIVSNPRSRSAKMRVAEKI
ncbi:MAG: 16S rRNA (cytosine(1402)-N(4))-methyltransferase RsmH [Anaerolineaceae bacterium]|nr:16S rRNA (cytosine(1402)-N(4))-methyltransferase RsmH [Anaerolineaceae bacterium]